jgi:hypothetical protein
MNQMKGYAAVQRSVLPLSEKNEAPCESHQAQAAAAAHHLA